MSEEKGCVVLPPGAQLLPAPKFPPGSLVRLKSGSPALTVDSVDPSGYSLVWFDGSVINQAGGVPEGVLVADATEVIEAGLVEVAEKTGDPNPHGIKVGDVVHLKSEEVGDAILMTVIGVGYSDLAVVWTTIDGKLRTATGLPAAAVEKVDSDDE